MRPNKIAVKTSSMLVGSHVEVRDLEFDEWIDLCIAFEVAGTNDSCAAKICQGIIDHWEDWRETWFGDDPVNLIGVKLYREALNEAEGQQLSVDQVG